MACLEQTRERLLTWLESPEADDASRAIAATGAAPDDVAASIRTVTEDPVSATSVVAIVEEAHRRGGIAASTVAIERWLLVREASAMLEGPEISRLGNQAQQLTCDEIATLLDDDQSARAMLQVKGIRFRELAKLVTARRFSAGLFHWDVSGVRRSWLAHVPPRDLVGLGRALVKLGGFAPVMWPHLNPRRRSPGLQEPTISESLAVMAETIERRPDLRGLAAASWLRSPDTHRVSPHLAAVNAPILASGGFVTTVGRASPDCGVFARSVRRQQLYDEGKFTPTVGLVLWARNDMLGWWRTQGFSKSSRSE